MLRGTCFAAAAFALAAGISAFAADPLKPEFQKSETELWGGPAPDSEKAKSIEGINPKLVSPRLTFVLPPEEKRNGTAIVICPGGGYGGLAVGHEGFEIANWMAERGICAFILEYRLPVFKGQTIYGPSAPSDDARRAVKTVRSKAAELKIDANKVGIIGFSAGGHLAATVAVHYDKGDAGAADELGKLSSRPDFAVLIYPVIDMSSQITHGGSKRNLLGPEPDAKLVDFYSLQKNVTSDTPPCFILSTTGDTTVPAENSALMYLALKEKKVPCELHVFENGVHGYGIRPGPVVTKFWPSLLEAWMSGRKLLPAEAK